MRTKLIISLFLGAFLLFGFQQARVLLKPNVRGNMTFVGASHIVGNAAMRGNDTFTTSATSDTVVFSSTSGVTSSSLFIVAIKDATPVANDLLSYTVNTDSLFVHRPVGTTSGLAYTYWRID